jgi:NAD(P)-dependent dehydrogenase (short-subunit alcohol dehydrogenase family)
MQFPKMFDLNGKVAVVTGAASGLGIAFSEAMAEAGADVVCSDIDVKGLEITVEKVKKIGRKAIAIACDVSKEDQVVNMVNKTVEAFGHLDILFNNAGIADATPTMVHEYPTDQWNQVMAVDLQGVFYCSREALKVMVKQKSGKIINIASIWGLFGASSIMPIPAYNAAKGAVVNLTREMGLEYATLGINVNAICPGFYVTRLAGGAYDNPDFVKAVTAFTPAGRLAGADELKGAAIFLASAASDFICGQMLVTDGGVTAK